jgi:hypothetical protein
MRSDHEDTRYGRAISVLNRAIGVLLAKLTRDIYLQTALARIPFATAMYYLNCKVTIGSMGMNLDEDLRYQPDIIVERKAYGRTHGVFRRLLQQGDYVKVSFPVYDYPVNNIPDPFYYGHLFETMHARNEREQTEIYVRVGGQSHHRP